jgi:hypothetical protein
MLKDPWKLMEDTHGIDSIVTQDWIIYLSQATWHPKS